MALVEILDISMAKLNPDRLWGCSIDVPVAGGGTEVYAIDVGGWALGRVSRVTAIDIVHEGVLFQRIPTSIPRRDVAEYYPKVRGAEVCGFWTTVEIVGMPPKFELFVNAVFEDKTIISLGVIRGRHQRIRSSFQPKLQPLMITTLGRTGSTFLMRIFDEHPLIVAQRLYPYETRAAGYWMHMLMVLSQPANHLQSSQPNSYEVNIWWVGHHPNYMPPITDPSQVHPWFGRGYVEELAAFCQQSIESFYGQVASSQGLVEPIYFVEKHNPRHTAWLTWELYPQAREIIMVRDFRDMVCSMLDFYRKRGLVSFGRETANSDEEFIYTTIRAAALRLLKSWKSRSAQAHLLRYEDLILHPDETLTVLLDYLSLDCTHATVKKMIRRASEDAPATQQHRTSPYGAVSIGRWRRELDASLRAACQDVFGEMLKEFGYEDDLQRLSLSAHDRL